MTERGDTIVEVLLVIAVLAMVLGGAYSSARRSLLTTQQTQERGEAVKYVEQQLERLRVASDAPNAVTTGVLGSGGASTFCLDGAYVIQPAPSAACVAGENGRYDLRIDRTTANVNGNPHYTFHAQALWVQIGDDTIEEVHMYYRVHPSL